MESPYFIVSYTEENCTIIPMPTCNEAIEVSNLLENSGIITAIYDNYENAKTAKNEYIKRRISILESTIESLKAKIEP